MGAERRNAFAVRPRDQPAPGARMARSSRDVVRVEEIGELGVANAIAGKMRDQEELLEEPRSVRAMPLGRAGIRHRLHHLVLGAQRGSAALRLRAHGAKGFAPDGARIVRRGGWERWSITLVTAATKDGGRSDGRHAQSWVGEIEKCQMTRNGLRVSIVPSLYVTGRAAVAARAQFMEP